MIFKESKIYDVLKWFVTVFLPALETLWLTIGDIWGLPYVVPIGATIAAIIAFLGALLGISSIQYNKKMKEEAEAKEVIGDDA